MSVSDISIDYLKDHINCKAKAFLIKNLVDKPTKLIIHERKYKILNDLILMMCAGKNIEDKLICNSINTLFEGLNYSSISKDKDTMYTVLVNFSRMFREYEYSVLEPVTAFGIGYNGVAIDSRWDMIVQSGKTNYKHPAIIDFSTALYDIEFNPIVYHAQTICDFMEIKHSSTSVVVFSIGSGKVWTYDNHRYGNIIKLSIEESMEEIKNNYCGVRFGFWCRTCYYRGICGGLLTNGRKA